MTLRIIYPRLLEENPNKLTKFKSDMGDRLRIATEKSATYEIFSIRLKEHVNGSINDIRL